MILLLPARSSDRIHRSSTAVNHVCPRPVDGRLGSSLPAPWVCLRQIGPCIHLLAPCLPTVRRTQVCGGAYAALPDRASPQGLCFQLPLPYPRYGDRGGYRTASARLAVCHKLKKHFLFYFSVNCRLQPEDPGANNRAVRTGRLFRGDCPSSNGITTYFILDGNLTDLLGLIFAE